MSPGQLRSTRIKDSAVTRGPWAQNKYLTPPPTGGRADLNFSFHSLPLESGPRLRKGAPSPSLSWPDPTDLCAQLEADWGRLKAAFVEQAYVIATDAPARALS
jgi:hypothetical protein